MPRIPCKQCGIVPAKEAVILNIVRTMDLASLSSYLHEDLRAVHLEDPSNGLILISKDSTSQSTLPSSCSSEDRQLLQLWDQLNIVNGLCTKHFVSLATPPVSCTKEISYRYVTGSWKTYLLGTSKFLQKLN